MSRLLNNEAVALAEALTRAIARLEVGISKTSTADCTWYEGIEGDALDELKQVQSKLNLRGESEMVQSLEVYMPDLFEYGVPEEVPAWEWIEKAASFAHVGNGEEGGVWEFQVNVECYKTRNTDPVPKELKQFFKKAKANGFNYICFHQG